MVHPEGVLKTQSGTFTVHQAQERKQAERDYTIHPVPE